MHHKGICVAGNMIVDLLYPIQGIPKPGELTTITGEIGRSTGGAVCNVIIDLAKLDPDLPLTALGRLGMDTEGDFVLEKLLEYKNIDISNIKRDGSTSFTTVMADEFTKQRTFFHFRGANANFCEADIHWPDIQADFLHIGYLLLLDSLDEKDPVYGTKMAKLLHEAKQRGLKTSIDVVSEASARFSSIVTPALQYTDYCIINEVEAQATTGIALRSKDGAFLRDNIPSALSRMKALGVSIWSIIHCPEGGFGLNKFGEFVSVESLRLPDGYIKGTVGAGDAFCAGVLYAAWKDRSIQEALVLGTACAACSLSKTGATEGILPQVQALTLYQKLR